jgi:hypothetical protein
MPPENVQSALSGGIEGSLAFVTRTTMTLSWSSLSAPVASNRNRAYPPVCSPNDTR